MSKKKVWVIMQTAAAGPEFSYPVGAKVEVEAETAEAWVEAGSARLLSEGEIDQATGRTRHVRAFVVEEETLTAPEQATGTREKGKR